MIDTTSLFLHVLAAIGLIGGGLVQVLAGERVRRATATDELIAWAGFARRAGLLIVGSAVLSLLTGGHLAGAVWGGAAGGFANPFITLGVAGLVLLAPIGPMMGGARLRRLVEAAQGAGAGPVPDELATAARSPALWGPVHSLVGVGIGLVALMVYQPTWFGGVALLLATFALGWLSGVLVARASGTAATPASTSSRATR